MARARALGEVTGRLHTALGSENADPAFAPEDTSAEALGLLTATVDEEIERIFVDLPELPEATTCWGRSAAAARRCATSCSG